MGQKRFVDVRLRIDEAGNTVDVAVEAGSGSASVDDAAREVALSRLYSPATSNGEPVAIWLEGVRILWPLIVIDGVPRPDLGWPPYSILDRIDRIDIGPWPETADWAGSKVVHVSLKPRD